jgi:hypothetical protein
VEGIKGINKPIFFNFPALENQSYSAVPSLPDWPSIRIQYQILFVVKKVPADDHCCPYE